MGFAPLSDLERVVLEVERSLNCAETKRLHPEIGHDIKVMGVRRDSIIRLTVGCAFVGMFVNDINLAAGRIAAALVARIDAAREATCVLVSEIGRPVNDPELVDVELRLATDGAGDGLDQSVHAIVAEELAQLDDLREALLDGRAIVY